MASKCNEAFWDSKPCQDGMALQHFSNCHCAQRQGLGIGASLVSTVVSSSYVNMIAVPVVYFSNNVFI